MRINVGTMNSMYTSPAHAGCAPISDARPALAPMSRLAEADDGAGQLPAVGAREVRGDITPARTLGDPYVRKAL
jgi:hypothetical protein